MLLQKSLAYENFRFLSCPQPGGEQTHGEKTANGLDGARSASLVANADARVERGTRRDLPPLVPAVSTRNANGAEGSSVTPRFLVVSYSGTTGAVRVRVGLYRHGELVGVAVFSHPCAGAVLTRTGWEVLTGVPQPR